MSTEPQRTCPSCSNEFSGAVCMLRRGLAGGVASGESSLQEAANPTPVQVQQRFKHYEVVPGEDGRPVELGRGAMGRNFSHWTAARISSSRPPFRSLQTVERKRK